MASSAIAPPAGVEVYVRDCLSLRLLKRAALNQERAGKPARVCLRSDQAISVNISKQEQRTLHALAQGGRIQHFKSEKGDLIEIDCLTREGWRLADCTLPIFQRLRRRGFIMSREGGPYRITRAGLAAVRAQLDNR